MTKELAKTLTTALVQFIDRERPEETMCCSNAECESIEQMFEGGCYDIVEAFIRKKLTGLTEFEQCLLDYANARDEYKFDSTKIVELNNKVIELTKSYSKKLLALAKQELLSYHDESNPKIEAMADLERAVTCGNVDNIPKWLVEELNKAFKKGQESSHEDYLRGYTNGYEDAEKRYNELVAYHYDNDLGKKHLEGYILGREDTMREMKDFIDSHFNCEKAKKGEPIPLQVEIPNMPTTPSGWGCDGTHCTNPHMDCINCPRKTTGGMASTYSGTSSATLHGNTSITDGKEHNPSFTD